MLFSETLRLYPSVPNVLRKVTKSYTFSDAELVLEKDLQVWLPIYAIHRDPRFYRRPNDFNPDNFAPEVVESRHTHAFIPFSDGPRNCIGMRFAQVEVKFVIATVVDNFRLSVNDKTADPIELDKADPNLAVKGGIWLDAQPL